jgi:predicted HD superfamily hydrolase involved in NAD metabolism
MDYAELSSVLDGRLDAMLSPGRAAHSRRVAALTASICEREGIDPAQGKAAGLAHDMCKEMPRKSQRDLAAAYPGAADGASRSIEGSILLADKVMHGPAAAAMLAKEYGVSDEAFLEAIALHTVGKPGMSGLSVILYCADKLEPGRERHDSEFRNRCLAMRPDAMLLAVVAGVIEWLRSKDRAVAPETLVLYDTLRRKAAPE